jgi:hypothetical protein
MIRNERELRAAMEWIEYWKSTRSGAQSWIGNEQAAQKIIELRRQVDEYRSRTRAAAESAASPAGTDPGRDQSVSSTV